MKTEMSQCKYCIQDPTEMFVCDYLRELQVQDVPRKHISTHAKNVCYNPESCKHFWRQIDNDGKRICEDLEAEFSGGKR